MAITGLPRSRVTGNPSRTVLKTSGGSDPPAEFDTAQKRMRQSQTTMRQVAVLGLLPVGSW